MFHSLHFYKKRSLGVTVILLLPLSLLLSAGCGVKIGPSPAFPGLKGRTSDEVAQRQANSVTPAPSPVPTVLPMPEQEDFP